MARDRVVVRDGVKSHVTGLRRMCLVRFMLQVVMSNLQHLCNDHFVNSLNFDLSDLYSVCVIGEGHIANKTSYSTCWVNF